MNEKQEFYFQRLKDYVHSKGGECLSKGYINCRTKLEFQCEKGHTWKAKPGSIVNDGCWCFICKIEKQKYSTNDVIHFIKNKGGELLSKEYISVHKKLKIKCNKSHIWEACFANLKKGNWCHSCSVLNQYLTKEEKLNAFNLISKIAEKKGGKCLSFSSGYKHTLSKLKFKCSKNHEWGTTASSIKHNKWCPICCQGISEKLFRYVLETIFNYKFPSSHPKWLRSDRGFKLEIDGYNKKLKLGFEYQGEHHFIFSSHFHRTQKGFERRLSIDRQKKNILHSHNIFMLYPTYKLKKEDYFDYIKSQTIDTPYEKLANFTQTVDINNIYKMI